MSRRKRVRNRPAAAESDHEVYRYGPLVFERTGKQIVMHNDMTAEQHAAQRQKMVALRPQLHDDITKKIARLIAIIERCNPMELLSAAATHYLLLATGPEDLKCHFVEFLVSMVAADDQARSTAHAAGEAIDEAFQLVENIFNDVQHYFGFAAAEHDRPEAADSIHHSAILNLLYVRGEAYPAHYIQLVRDEFGPHDAVLRTAYGVGVEEIIAFSESVTRQVEATTNQTTAALQSALDSQKLFGAFADSHNFTSFEAMRDAFNELPEVKQAAELLSAMPASIFVVQPGGLPAAVIQHLTLRPGDNTPFRFARADCWPTNGSLLYEKPLLELDGVLYCFTPQTFSMNLRKVLQGLLKTANPKYFGELYRKRRGELLEQHSLDLLASKLPGAEVYRGLYYTLEENGEQKRAEADGLILFDGYAILVEAKGAELTESGKRGGLERLRTDLGKIATEGQSQHARTLTYIAAHERPVFEQQNGKLLLAFDKQKYPRLIPIVTSIENINYLMASMKTMVELGIVAPEPMPWFVALSDLQVITDISESPAQLVQYIERRRRSYDKPFYHSMDELDSFGHYLKEGLYFEGVDKAPTLMMFSGYTDDLDAFYAATGPRPRFNIPESLRTLVASVEASDLPGRTEVAIALLAGDDESQELIADRVAHALRTTAADGADHSVTVSSVKNDDTGLTIITYLGDAAVLERLRHKYRDYAALKKYQLRKTTWLLVFIDQAQPDTVRLLDRLESPWIFNPTVEDRVTLFASSKVDQALRERKKIGRNERCPCNSGKKYKKCCLDKEL